MTRPHCRFQRLIFGVAMACTLWLSPLATVLAQGRGPAVLVRGTIIDRTGTVEGAHVEFAPNGDNNPTFGRSDEDGRFRLRLASGSYQVIVTADGYLPSEGRIDVTNLTAALEIELRRVDEQTPAFPEGNVERTVRKWLERGNQLLEAGAAEAAQAEFEKALPLVQGATAAEIYRGVARAAWLLERPEETRAALENALRADPGDQRTRALYNETMKLLEREADAERFLEHGIHEVLPEAATNDPPETARRPKRRPPTRALAHRTGDATVVFETPHSLSLAEIAEKTGHSFEAQKRAASLDPAAESWEIVVPESYDPATPHGLLVWISPTPRGVLPNPGLLPVLEERRLIWVGANSSGNRRAVVDRIALAFTGLENTRSLYSIDSERLFIAGYSGGGRVASVVGAHWPESWAGVISWMGIDFFASVPVPYRPGASWPGSYKRPSRATLKRARRIRWAVVTGDLDFNRSQSRAIAKTMRGAGFEHVAFLQIPDADHYRGFPAEWVERALEAVDR